MKLEFQSQFKSGFSNKDLFLKKKPMKNGYLHLFSWYVIPWNFKVKTMW